MRTNLTRLVLVSLLAAGVGCSRTAPAPTQGAKADAAPAPAVVKPKREAVRRSIGQPGQIEAYQQAPLYAKVAGYVQEMKADIGADVTEDQVLAVLFVPELDEELAQKEALVKQAKAEKEQADKVLAAGEAHVETAQALVPEAKSGKARAAAMVRRWKTEHDRLEAVVKDRVLDRQTLEETRYQYEAAKAGQEEVDARVSSAEATAREAAARRDKAKADVAAAAAKVLVAEAEQRRLAAMKEYTNIKAPFAGKVFRRYIDKGHFVQPAAAGSNRGEPLYVVVQTKRLRVFVDVPEADAVWVGEGTPAKLRVAGLPGREFDGKVVRTSFALDPKTRTLRTEIDVDNPGELRPNMYAYATVEVVHDKAWTLPAAAVVVQGEQAYCFRDEGGKAVKTPVQVGLREGGVVEVLKKRTKAGDKATWEDFTEADRVVANAAGVSEGQAVK